MTQIFPVNPRDTEACRLLVSKSLHVMGTPLFLRTDHTAAKKLWSKTCYLAHIDYFNSQWMNLRHYSMKHQFPVHALVIRKVIDAETKFFNGEQPIFREFRVFIDKKRIQHIQLHCYPKKINEPSNPLWKQIREMMSPLSAHEKQQLSNYAERIYKLLPGYWAMDFLQGKDGVWYFIDMADGYTAIDTRPVQDRPYRSLL